MFGSNSSSDKDAWNRRRDENHDTLRTLMHAGKLDLDPNDTQLNDEILLITYGPDTRGAIKITPKRDMKTELGGSPDRLDALIYSVIDSSPLVNNSLAGVPKGTVVNVDPWALLNQKRHAPGMPM